jgi:hypothetical protein
MRNQVREEESSEGFRRSVAEGFERALAVWTSASAMTVRSFPSSGIWRRRVRVLEALIMGLGLKPCIGYNPLGADGAAGAIPYFNRLEKHGLDDGSPFGLAGAGWATNVELRCQTRTAGR